MKKQKALNRLAAVAAVLLTLCLVFAAPVSAEVTDTYVAKIGDTGYATLQAAFEAAQDEDTITVLKDITIDSTTAFNGGTYIDGVQYTGDKSFTVDFGRFTVTDDGCVNDYLIYLNNKGENENTITFTNGKLVSKNGCWATVCVGSKASSTKKTVLNLNGMEITNSNDDDYAGNLGVRVRGNENAQNTVNVNANTVITSDGASYGAGSNPNAILNINTGAKVIQKNSGTTSGNSVFTAVGGNGVINIYDGAVITSDKHGVHTMTSETPVVNIYGGTITSAEDGFALWASTNGGANELSTINVYGGTINGKLGEYNGDSRIFVSGGTFSTDVAEYLKEGYTATQSDSKYVVSATDAVAQIGDATYASLADAVEAAEAGDTVTLLKNIENLQATIKIEKKLTITGGESQKSITTSQKKIFEVYADAGFENLNLRNTASAGRCIDTRVGGIDVNINNCELETTSTANNQPLTIGGNDKSGLSVTLSGTTINAGAAGYGIITFVPVNLNIEEKSTINGYAALYFKDGSNNAVVNVKGGSELKGENVHNGDTNSFATVVFEKSNNIQLTLSEEAAVAFAKATGDQNEAIFGFKSGVSGNRILIEEGVNLKLDGDKAVFISGTPNTITIENGVTSTFPIDSKYLNAESLCIPDGTGYKVVAKTYKLTATEKVGFDSVKVGYTQPEPQIVTVTNNCNVPVKLEQPSSTNYVIGTLSATELAPQGTATFTIQPVAGLAVGNYADSITVKTNTTATADIEVSFLVYQPSSGGSSKPVEEPVDPEVPVEPEVPTEEPEAGEATVETEVTDGGEVELETPTAGGSAAADEDEAKITGVVLPTGTDSEVTFVPVSEQAAPEGKETQTKKVFEINVPTYEKGKAAVIKFTMTVAELAADGKEAADVALWHFDEETGEWTKLVTSYTIVDGVVYFEAITNDFSPFAIVYEDEPVDEPVDEPETPASPAPVLGLIAALGAAVALRRK